MNHEEKIKETAARMIQRYGKDAPIHATYNAMNHERGTPASDYWLAVSEEIKNKKEPTA